MDLPIKQKVRNVLIPLGAWMFLFAVVVATTNAETRSSPNTGPPPQDNFSRLRTGAQIYKAACATCHGLDGTGSSRSTVGFDTPLPDFTDCSFASRERHADWFAIAHNGGPTRAFDRMMPAFGGAITDGQIEKAAAHVKSFCREPSWPPGEFNLPRPLATGKAFPEDELAFEIESTVEEPVSVQAAFIAEKRLGARGQIELAVPVGVQQVAYEREDGSTGLRWGEGLGDIALGLKGVLWHALSIGSIGSLGGEVFFPVGDEADDFSKGIFRFEPFLAIGQVFPGNNFIQLHGGAELSTDVSAAPHELFWRGAMGHTFTEGRFGRAWSPMIEVLGAQALESGSSSEWSLIPELHLTLSRRQHVMITLGVEIPVTEFDERQIAISAHLLWDWFDGGFAEGW